MTNDVFVLAADIGGTHITAALIDMSHRKVVQPSLTRKNVDANASADHILSAWSECLKAAKKDADILSICVAMPGPFDYDGGVSLIRQQGKFDALFGLNIKDSLARAMEMDSSQIFTENDAACFLQGEVFAGTARNDHKKVIGVTLGTGVGTAVYENGRSRSADLWNIPFLDGIAEDYLSTRWFAQRYYQLSGTEVSGVRELMRKVDSDHAAKTVFSEFGKNLGTFVARFIEQEKPEVVVIAGNISNAYPLFQHGFERELLSFPAVSIKRSILGEQSALLGAAGSWYNSVKSRVAFP